MLHVIRRKICKKTVSSTKKKERRNVIYLPQNVQNPNTYCPFSTVAIALTILIVTRNDGEPNIKILYGPQVLFFMILRKGWPLCYKVKAIFVSSDYIKDIDI
jgi:hypothetical protein